MAAVLTRESIRDDYVQRLIEHEGEGWTPLSEDEMLASRESVLRRIPPSEDVWIFGYGSLIWNPAFHFVDTRVGTLFGYHRRFCLWTTMGRGSPDYPGLILGLERGGCCHGLAMRIAPEAVETETDIIWRREMLRGAYIPRLVRLRSAGAVIRAVTFVINHRHGAYAGILPEHMVVERLARAEGRLGPCAEYLSNTVEHLDELGVQDRHMTRLRDQVQRLCLDSGASG